ncbi:hypothetical protein M911_01580 [Ectothiorhodospira haloalkaliphila]|uniref:Uncharacterized protein n=1 Tax=Ectothiorhodospira haloalkaliphila TaxID=421628 RepID=W8KRC4_9GAMM|nr:hypothetical protein [Ectothiorhodospira haloalkaliphila]AHK78106.1 hypothetical protein M911_01580 [Ectothiorhodospira haloalkaliphila]
MPDRKSLEAALKRLDKLDADLSKALDKLAATRADGTPDQMTKARQAAEGLESKLESAYHDAQEAHRVYWTERMHEEKAGIREALEVLARYRWCCYCRDDAPHGLDGAVHEAVQALGSYPAHPPEDFLDGLPAVVPEPEALERAESEI